MPSSDTSPSDSWEDTLDPSDPNAPSPITPERVQSVLESRNRHVPAFINMIYGDAPKLHRTIITKNLQNFQAQVLRTRALTDDEVGALADHWSASANIALTAKPFVWAMTLFLTWRGRARFRFPFWQPKWVNTAPEVFPTISRPILNGRAATFAWHASRLAVYAVFCNWFVTPFFLSYAGVRATVGISSDPRLQEAVKESVKDVQMQRRINHMQRRTGKIPTRFPPEQQDQAEQSGDHSQEGGSESWGSRDIQSPQASHLPEPSGTQRWNVPQKETSQPQQSQPYTTGTYQPRQSPKIPQPSEPSTWEEDPILGEIEEDDASPVAPSARAQEVRRQRAERAPRRHAPPPDDGISAWERLRERAQSERNDDDPNRRR
ncbi:hypothetical protein jhhlp_003313 [Lomentospora prolificans]|uniref:Uncharacterized protein n=1 Tax=Lomentospora prolificans TaxID=41688 RepID=A0A2N3NGJ8_9PEZI|nr:hypothetical protein jhhlp_003313 [Lomentospora prolificans]